MSNLRLWEPFEKPPECVGCPLKETGKSFVPGIGDENAALVIIGERPGANEILQGEPFVGKSGKELDYGLGGTRGGVYITNVRKCLGAEKEDKDIKAASISHCVNAFLRRELETIRSCRVVLAVGADALRITTGLHEATKFHGSVWTRPEVEAIARAASNANSEPEEGDIDEEEEAEEE